METQAMLVPAIGALHNFVRIHDRDDNAEDLANDAENAPRREDSSHLEDFVSTGPREITPEELGMHISDEERARASARRDRIANQMWADYVTYLAAHGEVPNA